MLPSTGASMRSLTPASLVQADHPPHPCVTTETRICTAPHLPAAGVGQHSQRRRLLAVCDCMEKQRAPQALLGVLKGQRAPAADARPRQKLDGGRSGGEQGDFVIAELDTAGGLAPQLAARALAWTSTPQPPPQRLQHLLPAMPTPTYLIQRFQLPGCLIHPHP